METDSTLLELKEIALSYGSVSALKDINFKIRKGENHALVGEHGAGKSSLAAVIGGDTAAKKGDIFFEGKRLEHSGVHIALQLGIKSVYQQILLNDYFTVAESLYYANRAVNRHAWISKRKMTAAAEKLLGGNGFQLPATRLIRHLNLSDRTVVDILRCLVNDTRLLIIDEGLDNLSTDSYGKIVSLLRQRKSAGMSVLFITHKIDDVYSIADRVSIIRDGSILTTDNVANIDKLSLVRLTYTQVSKGDADIRSEKDFYTFLKYNEAILKNLPVALLVVDGDENIKMLNDTCRTLFTWNDKDLGKSLVDRLGSVNREVHRLLAGAFANIHEHSFYHVRLILANQTLITNIQTLPIMDGDDVIGHIIIIEDVTDYEQMQKQLILSEKLASVGLLAAGVAHEINNPLEIIYNYLTYLRYNYADEQLLSFVEKINGEIMNISGIISNLVSFSDGPTPNPENVDPNELCKDILTLIKYNAKYKDIRLVLVEGSDVPKLEANRNELRQVILNLIRNSFEAMPGGGMISIYTSRVCQQGLCYAEIRVCDEGNGLDESEAGNIFMPFFSTKRGKENNMGLGLSISYAIIEKYHGTMSARNNEVRGCTFIITLPALPDEEKPRTGIQA